MTGHDTGTPCDYSTHESNHMYVFGRRMFLPLFREEKTVFLIFHSGVFRHFLFQRVFNHREGGVQRGRSPRDCPSIVQFSPSDIRHRRTICTSGTKASPEPAPSTDNGLRVRWAISETRPRKRQLLLPRTRSLEIRSRRLPNHVFSLSRSLPNAWICSTAQTK
jgi:hypothetical protein